MQGFIILDALLWVVLERFVDNLDMFPAAAEFGVAGCNVGVAQRLLREALDNPGHVQCGHDAARVVTGKNRRSGSFSEAP